MTDRNNLSFPISVITLIKNSSLKIMPMLTECLSNFLHFLCPFSKKNKKKQKKVEKVSWVLGNTSKDKKLRPAHSYDVASTNSFQRFQAIVIKILF